MGHIGCSANHEGSLLKPSERGRKLVGLEAKGSGLALVGDPALPVNQIKAIGPAGVGALGGVAKLIEHGRKFQSQLAHTSTRKESPFFFVLRTGKNNLVFYVALHLPDVAGMSFGDVHHQKSNAVGVLFVEFVESGSLPPEGRSSVAAKNQDDRLLLVQY